jgi:hypothetical protein
MHSAGIYSPPLRFPSSASVRPFLFGLARMLDRLWLDRPFVRFLPFVFRPRNVSSTVRIRKIVNNLLLLATTLHVRIVLFALLLPYLLIDYSSIYALFGNAFEYVSTLGKYTDMLAGCIENHP